MKKECQGITEFIGCKTEAEKRKRLEEKSDNAERNVKAYLIINADEAVHFFEGNKVRGRE